MGGQKANPINYGKGSAFDMSDESAKYNKSTDQQMQQAIKNEQFIAPAQNLLNQQLLKQTQGEGPSVAESQLKANSSKNLAQQLAAASGSKRKGANDIAALAALKGQASNADNMAQQTGAAKAGETLGSQSLLSNNLNQATALQNALIQNYVAQGFDLATATKRAQQKAAVGQQGLNATQTEVNAGRTAALTGGLLNAGGQLAGAAFGASGSKPAYTPISSTTATPAQNAAMAAYAPEPDQLYASDKRVKTDIKTGKQPIRSFLDALSAKEYEYKKPHEDGDYIAPAGKQVGIMAQDLEKSQVGKQMVEEMPDGMKAVNPTKGFGAVLAAQADLHKRIKKLEKRS